MAYGKLAEGNRVWTAVSGPALSADINELQDQLALILGPRAVVPPLSAAWYYTRDGDWYFRPDSDPPYWERSGSHANPLYLPLGTIREGQRILSVDVIIRGDQPGGSIDLYRNVISDSAGSAVNIGNAGTDPWNTAGTWTKRTLTFTAENAQNSAAYWLLFKPPALGTMQILGAIMQVAFGPY